MNQSNYHVGDVLYIREWDEMAEEFGLTSGGSIMTEIVFIHGMKELCGEKFTISSIKKCSIGVTHYLSEEGIEVYDTGHYWYITADMLTDRVAQDIDDYEFDSILGLV